MQMTFNEFLKCKEASKTASDDFYTSFNFFATFYMQMFLY